MGYAEVCVDCPRIGGDRPRCCRTERVLLPEEREQFEAQFRGEGEGATDSNKA